jgi:hypothetical protein
MKTIYLAAPHWRHFVFNDALQWHLLSESVTSSTVCTTPMVHPEQRAVIRQKAVEEAQDDNERVGAMGR